MGHFISKGTTTRIELNDKGEWEVIFHFSSKWGEVDYLKLTETGNYVRYIYECGGCGWLIDLPGEKHKYYGQSCVVEEADFCKTDYQYTFDYPINTEELEAIAESRPDLKYTIKKYIATRKGYVFTRELVKLLREAKEHSEVELLVQLGLTSLATDKMFFKLKKDKQQKILIYIKQNIGHLHNACCREMLMMLNSGIKDMDVAYSLIEYGCDAKLCDYLTKNQITLSLYKDYKRMAKENGKNMNDPYWKYPKDFHKAHREVLEDKRRKENDSYFLVKEKGKTIDIAQMLIDIYGSNSKEQVIDGYKIYLCYDKEDITNHATDLHQCILRCSYIKDMAFKKTLLLFVKDLQGKSIATCQITKNKTIKQFYADEFDRSNCTPTQEVQDAMAKYLKTTSFKGVWS